jgi:hypothetical protein
MVMDMVMKATTVQDGLAALVPRELPPTIVAAAVTFEVVPLNAEVVYVAPETVVCPVVEDCANDCSTKQARTSEEIPTHIEYFMFLCFC